MEAFYACDEKIQSHIPSVARSAKLLLMCLQVT